MNQTAIELLKKQAEVNPVLKDLACAFGVRKRTRAEITMSNLMHFMSKHKFEHTEYEYCAALQTLADAGVGELVYDHKHQIKALKKIRVDLKSLGKAVSGHNEKPKAFRPRNKFQRVHMVMPAVIKKAPALAPTEPKPSPAPTSITLPVNGKPVTLQLPKDITVEEVALLVSQICATGGR